MSSKENEVDELDDELIEEDDTEEENDEEPTLTASEVAKLVGTDPKTFRRFIRAKVIAGGGAVGVDTPGSGGRYAFLEAEVEQIKADFETWRKPKAKTVTVDVEDDDYDEEDLDEDFVDEAEDDSVEEDAEIELDEDIEEIG